MVFGFDSQSGVSRGGGFSGSSRILDNVLGKEEREVKFEVNSRAKFTGDLEEDLERLEINADKSVDYFKEGMKVMLGNYFEVGKESGRSLGELWKELGKRGCGEVLIKNGEVKFLDNGGNSVEVSDLVRGAPIEVFPGEGEKLSRKERLLQAFRVRREALIAELMGV